MGQVYHATDTQPERDVAPKILTAACAAIRIGRLPARHPVYGAGSFVALAAVLVGFTALSPYTRLQAQQPLGELPLDELRALAEQGDADAQFNLGVRYATGRGCPFLSSPRQSSGIDSGGGEDTSSYWTLGIPPVHPAVIQPVLARSCARVHYGRTWTRREGGSDEPSMSRCGVHSDRSSRAVSHSRCYPDRSSHTMGAAGPPGHLELPLHYASRATRRDGRQRIPDGGRGGQPRTRDH